MHPISERIVSILTHPSDRAMGATLLTGPWGCGKTHLWLNEIRESLRSTHNKNPVYISLFGLTSTEDIRSRVISAWIRDSISSKTGDSLLLDHASKAGSLLGPALGKLRKVLNGKLGFDPIPIKIDWLQFLPEQSIICFDDIERAGLPADATLGTINYLIEHRKVRVLLIANEEHLKASTEHNGATLYDKYKEKVIWTSVRFSPNLDSTFDIFINDIKNEGFRTKLAAIKPLALQIFKDGDWENIRTLQRVLRYLEELLSLEDLSLPEESLRYLIAVLIEDARTGLRPDRAYDVRRFLAQELRNKISNKESTQEDKIGLAFYQRYFENKRDTGYSPALYRFVKDGLLPRDELYAEFKPSEKPLSEDQRLLKEIQADWLFKPDQEISDFLKRVAAFLMSQQDAPAHCVLTLYYHLHRLSSQIKATIPTGLEDAIEQRLRVRAKMNDQSLDPHYFHYDSKDAQALLDKLVREYHSVKDSYGIEDAKKRIIAGLTTGDLDFFIMNINADSFLLRAALDSSILATAHSVFFSQPIAFFRFYKALIKLLSQSGYRSDFIDVKTSLEELRTRIEAATNQPKLDNTGKIRMQILGELFPPSPTPQSEATDQPASNQAAP